MIDAITKEPMKVLSDPEAGAWLRVPATQIDAVVSLFQSRGLRCWRSEQVMSVNGRPATGYVYLSRNEKASAAQAVLDTVA
jgi:hypothetical protein